MAIVVRKVVGVEVGVDNVGGCLGSVGDKIYKNFSLGFLPLFFSSFFNSYIVRRLFKSLNFTFKRIIYTII